MTNQIRDTLEAAQRDADLLYWETGDEYMVNKTYQGTFYAIQVHPATGINSLKNISEQHFEQNNVANVTNVTTDEFTINDMGQKVYRVDETLTYTLDALGQKIFKFNRDGHIDQAKRVVDSALEQCKENPAILGSDEFQTALGTLCKESDALFFEYRCKLKAAKPSGIPLSAFKGLERDSEASSGVESIANELLALVIGKGKLFFDDSNRNCFVTVDIDDVEHTMLIGSRAFMNWLSYAYYTATKSNGAEFGTSASEGSIKQACYTLNGHAEHEGERHNAYLRTAQKNDAHYLFIADEKRQVIEVTPTGWRVLKKSPVKFYKTDSMQALPIPTSGGDINDLWQFVNVPEKDKPLVLAWILEALRYETKKPVLAITGMQGTAKSSTNDKIRQLIDPNVSNLRVAPKNREDVFVSAGCNWVVCFENISKLTPDIQDAICTLSTGGGFASRKLFTNAEEEIISVMRPVIINSIPTVATAQDLTDRLVAIDLEPIKYREDSEINELWNEAKPTIFGALLDLFVRTLEKLPDVKLDNPPRMADFTKLGEAMMQSQGHPSGTFTSLYVANKTESIAKSLESSPVAVAICEMAEKYHGASTLIYNGTMAQLLTELQNNKTYGESLPRSPRGLGDALKRQSPALASYGINISVSNKAERINGNRGVNVQIRKGGNIGNIGNVETLENIPEKIFPVNSGNIGNVATLENVPEKIFSEKAGRF